MAASSFAMKVTDPKPFLDAIDKTRLKEILGHHPINTPKNGPVYIEPSHRSNVPLPPLHTYQEVSSTDEKQTTDPPLYNVAMSSSINAPDIRQGKVQRLGDFIDTDAVSAGYRIVNENTLITNSSRLLKFSPRALPTKSLGSIA